MMPPPQLLYQPYPINGAAGSCNSDNIVLDRNTSSFVSFGAFRSADFTLGDSSRDICSRFAVGSSRILPLGIPLGGQPITLRHASGASRWAEGGPDPWGFLWGILVRSDVIFSYMIMILVSP